MTEFDTDDTKNTPLVTQLRAALWAWGKSREEGRVLQGLALVSRHIAEGKTPLEASNKVLEEAVAALKGEHPEFGEFLEKRFGKGISMGALTRKDYQSERALYMKQRDAIGHLASVLLQQEAKLKQERRRLLSNLPKTNCPYLVGGAPKLATLIPLLSQPQTASLVVLSGIGGIGKTTLANELVSHLVLTSVYDRFAWVSAGQAVFNLGGRIVTMSERPALTLEHLIQSLAAQLLQRMPTTPLPHHELQELVLQHLLANPHLVVIDNLETVPDVNHLLPFLRQVSETTRVVMTSRVQLLDEGDVYPYIVPPLSFEEAHELLRQEAQSRNIPVLMSVDERVMERIYNVVGGNPLALRLIAGQIHYHGLDAVLQDLKSTGGVGEQLYSYLFDWTWASLSDMGRAVFLAMPLLTDSGGTLQELVSLTDFPVIQVRRALHELVERNLVNVEGDALQRRYTIHNLTRAFLQEQVAGWM